MICGQTEDNRKFLIFLRKAKRGQSVPIIDIVIKFTVPPKQKKRTFTSLTATFFKVIVLPNKLFLIKNSASGNHKNA